MGKDKGKKNGIILLVSRPVTRSYAKEHNNVVLERSVMGDAESLVSKLEAFMKHIIVRQQALEELIKVLTTYVHKVRKESGNKEARWSTNGNRDNHHGSEERHHHGSEERTKCVNRGPMVILQIGVSFLRWVRRSLGMAEEV